VGIEPHIIIIVLVLLQLYPHDVQFITGTPINCSPVDGYSCWKHLGSTLLFLCLLIKDTVRKTLTRPMCCRVEGVVFNVVCVDSTNDSPFFRLLNVKRNTSKVVYHFHGWSMWLHTSRFSGVIKRGLLQNPQKIQGGAP
jgi:hypothetical protein